jgi:hypothetical protein
MNKDYDDAWQFFHLRESANAIENKTFLSHKTKQRGALRRGATELVKMVSHLTKYNDFPDYAIADFRLFKQISERVRCHFDTYLIKDEKTKVGALNAIIAMSDGMDFQVIHKKEKEATEYLEVSTFDEMQQLTVETRKYFDVLMDLRSCDEQTQLKFQAGFDKLLKATKLELYFLYLLLS